ncbi:hypothetical protein LEP1GSC050_3592 [Leptospira broomii serovar Hurstbridge str. 5399]|uniref:Uncharacterized protein n=1 Tax=Leptospira broomii serovar Hurstbridge str. 5399 TaxID=1049789 RepID=T0FE65_9LEPT|nr:hypothetical protein LEP1GSC050_3592 [Leptospira broomii serovar Hurstbridge str. 5399]
MDSSAIRLTKSSRDKVRKTTLIGPYRIPYKKPLIFGRKSELQHDKEPD